MDEFHFINKIKQNTYSQASLVKGIGDDAAVFREPFKDTVTAVDTFVEGVHFSKQTMKSFHIGYRSLAANISDMAAMGATPAYYVVSIVVPSTYSTDDLREIYDGMSSIAKQYRMDLIGGDTVSGEQLVLSITIIGFVEKGKSRYRHSARNHDCVFVTGTLGDSQAGLHILMNKLTNRNQDYFINKHRMPEPRVDFAHCLSQLNRVTLNDVSDGIASEAAEIATASDVAIVLQDEDLPVHPNLSQFPEELQMKWKYFGGEDFELLGTIRESDWLFVQECAIKTGVSVTKIGYVIEQRPGDERVYMERKGKLHPLKERGYIHLK